MNVMNDLTSADTPVPSFFCTLFKIRNEEFLHELSLLLPVMKRLPKKLEEGLPSKGHALDLQKTCLAEGLPSSLSLSRPSFTGLHPSPSAALPDTPCWAVNSDFELDLGGHVSVAARG